jgi:hypothetical protein
MTRNGPKFCLTSIRYATSDITLIYLALHISRCKKKIKVETTRLNKQKRLYFISDLQAPFHQQIFHWHCRCKEKSSIKDQQVGIPSGLLRPKYWDAVPLLNKAKDDTKKAHWLRLNTSFSFELPVD